MHWEIYYVHPLVSSVTCFSRVVLAPFCSILHVLTLRVWLNSMIHSMSSVGDKSSGLFTLPTRRDRTVLYGLQLCSHFRQDSFVSSRPSFGESALVVWTQLERDKTVLSCRIGGVNTTADKTRQFCLVSSCVHTANSTKQDSLVRIGGVNKCQCASPCQISSKSVKRLWRYCDFTVSKMAAAAILDFQKFKFWQTHRCHSRGLRLLTRPCCRAQLQESLSIQDALWHPHTLAVFSSVQLQLNRFSSDSQWKIRCKQLQLWKIM